MSSIHRKPCNITIRGDSRRASTLSVDQETGTLKVLGNLPHGYQFEPDSIVEAEKLIEWCQAWIEKHKGVVIL